MENKFLHKAIVAWTNICRFVLAVVFIFSGFIKANDPLGTVYKIQDYFEAWNMVDLAQGFLPYVFALVIGCLEFVIGSYLLFGIRRRVAPMLTLLMMSFMTPLTLWLAVDNPISDCGCFGDALILTNWETFFKNVFLLIAAISVYKWNQHIYKFVSNKMDWLIALYSTVFIILFSLFSLNHLPTFDFRPYHLGADIRKKMEIPEGEKLPVYETILVYEKDGVKKEFTVDNYPEDSTWHFVDSKTILKEKGFVPEITDFTIISQEDGLDLTEDVLTEDYVFLLVSPWLEKADDSGMDLINELYDYSQDYGYRFLCVTSSSDETVASWQDYTGAEYPFATLDEITLKTMVRSNPGLMLLKNGVVIGKWCVSALPDEYQLTDSLDKLPVGQLSLIPLWKKILHILAWYFGPLLLFTFADQLWERFRKPGTKGKTQEQQDNHESEK